MTGFQPSRKGLRVAAKGFKAFQTTGVSVQADVRARIDPTLEAGSAAETVEANPETQPELKTDCADVATVFDQQQVSSLQSGIGAVGAPQPALK